MTEVAVTLVVGADADSEAVRAACRAFGLADERWLPRLRILTGRIAPDRIGALGQIEGVRSVERAGTVQLPPPGSPIQ
jgi:hypothetical protein